MVYEGRVTLCVYVVFYTEIFLNARSQKKKEGKKGEENERKREEEKRKKERGRLRKNKEIKRRIKKISVKI